MLSDDIGQTFFLMKLDNASPLSLVSRKQCVFSDADQLMATIEVICESLNGSMVQWPYFHHHQNCTG